MSSEHIMVTTVTSLKSHILLVNYFHRLSTVSWGFHPHTVCFGYTLSGVLLENGGLLSQGVTVVWFTKGHLGAGDCLWSEIFAAPLERQMVSDGSKKTSTHKDIVVEGCCRLPNRYILCGKERQYTVRQHAHKQPHLIPILNCVSWLVVAWSKPHRSVTTVTRGHIRNICLTSVPLKSPEMFCLSAPTKTIRKKTKCKCLCLYTTMFYSWQTQTDMPKHTVGW